jgi:hypothetical protein
MSRLGPRPDRRKMAGAVTIVILSALPAIQQLLIGPDMEKSRGLYLPSVGYALLIGAALRGIVQPTRKVVLANVLLVFHFAILKHNLAAWAGVSALARSTCASVASELRPGTRRLIAVGLPGSINGVYCFRNCFKECVEASLKRNIEEVEVVPAEPAVGHCPRTRSSSSGTARSNASTSFAPDCKLRGPEA